MCRRSARSSGQWNRSTYSRRLQRVDNGRAGGMKAKHKIKERVTQKKGRYCNERSVGVEFSEKSSLSSSSIVRKALCKQLPVWVRNCKLTN